VNALAHDVTAAVAAIVRIVVAAAVIGIAVVVAIGPVEAIAETDA
jgi:hypothetical protein